LHVLQVHDKIIHQQHHSVEIAAVVVAELHFLYPIKSKEENGKGRFEQHTKTSCRVSDSKRSKMRRASWILFDISSICLRL
jgi:hypothetical protein